MADNLIFPIKFDLEKGVKDALTDGDKALDRIAKALEKHPITIKLRMDNRVARGTSAELTGFKKQLAELTQQWNSLTAAERGSAAGAAIREKFRALRTEAQGYTSTLQAAVKAEDKMRESHSKTEASANKLSSAYHNQSTYLSRLIQRMAAYAGVSYVGNFLTNVREVTAQFELQRISLGAIIQDQQRANQLFEEIKTFALKSPVKILDLTKYTKQLAAYKIGVDELFDTTKRLTDISVGLGVSMDRIVLMYGQIRATGHLRASEVRQATEAGIPLVEELANKLSKANGELVTAADVMDMISKRAISFDMVKEVFDDMTSAGGIFYNMQEKQGNTLFGMWQKLGDAAAVMYDQIGNTSSVNEGMKMAIQTLRYLMLHWKQVGIVVGGVSVYILANTVATKNNAIATAAATTANKLHIASLQQKLGALRLEQMNLKSTAIFQRLHTAATISATKAQIGAATSTNVFSKALYGLKAALLSNPLTALAVALTTIIALLMQSESELDKLNSKLQDIDRDYDASGKKSVERFKELVKAVEENVDGSKAQKEALDELDRTYSKILGSEALELDSLKAMGGQYGELIELIEAYNAKKKGEERATAIKSSYATILDEGKDDLMDYLNQAGMSAEKQAEFISRLNEKMIEHAGEADAAIKATDETFQEFANDISQLDAAGNILNILNFDKLADAWGVGFRQIGGWFGGQGMDYLYNYARAIEGQNKALDENEVATRNAVRGLDEYAGSMDNLTKAINTGKDAMLDWSSQEALYNSLQKFNTQHPENAISIPIDLTFDPAKAKTEYDKMLESSNMRIHAIFANLQSIASQEGIAIPEEFYKQAKSVVEGNKDFSFIDFDGLAKLFTTDKAKNAVKESRLLYESIAPSDDTVRMFNRKFMTLADNMDVSLDKMQKYLMKSGDNLGEHRKKLSDEVTNLLKEIARLEWTKKALSLFGLPTAAVEAKIQESQQTLKLLQSMISTIPDIEGIGKKKKGGSKSDPRLQTLQEIANKMAEVNKEYDELLKKEGQTKALADTQKLFASSFKQMEATAKKYGFKLPAFEVPQTIEDVQKWYKAIMDNIKRLNLKNADKVLIELGFKSDKAAIDKQQNDIEKQLKKLADRISRTKTAKEFYEKILKSTGDANLALNLTTSIYGEDGQDLKKQVINQIKTALSETKVELPAGIIDSDNNINYKALREFAVKAKETRAIGEGVADELIKIAENGEKELSRVAQEGAKLLLKYDEIAQQRVNIEQEASEKIKALRDAEALYLASNASAEQKVAFTKRTNNAVAGVEADRDLELFKLKSEYLRYFSAIHSLTNKEANYVRDTFRKALFDAFRKGAISADKFKKEMAALNEQFDKLLDTSSLAMNFMSGGFDGLINKVKEMADEVENVGLEISRMRNKDGGTVMKIEDFSQGQKDYMDKMLKLFGNENTGNSFQSFFDKMGGDSSKMGEMFNKMGQGMKAGAGKMASAVAMVDMIIQMVNATIKGIAQIRDQLNEMRSEDNQLGGTFWDSFEYLENFNKYAYSGWEKLKSGDFVGASFDTVSSIISIFGTEQAQRIKRINKRIKEQQKAIEQLEYTYGRLEKAAEKLFGGDYVNNYNQQLKNLQAQQEAYLKQAEAEKSKGKKEDEEKTQEYLDKARDIGDQIADMQEDLIEHFTGSSRTDIARQMAQSWIDARASMSDTFAAIKGDYQDLIKNMLVETMAAKIIENAFSQVWKDVDERLKDNDVDGAVNAFINGMDTALTNANDGMEVWWKAMEARGFDMKDMFNNMDSEYTGIAKSVAGATSEEINNVAAIGNTLMYYVSPIPRIDENLARVVALMEGRGAALPTASGVATGVVDYTDLFNTANQHLSSLPRMEQHLAEIHTMLGRALRTKGATTGFNTFLNS